MKAKDKRIAEAEEKAKQKEAHKKLELFALMKAKEKRIAASIKAQQIKSTNRLKRLKEREVEKQKDRLIKAKKENDALKKATKKSDQKKGHEITKTQKMTLK